MAVHIDGVLKKASKLQHGQEYSKALEIIETTLEGFPQNPRLQRAREYARELIVRQADNTDPPSEVVDRLRAYDEDEHWQSLLTACSMLIKVHPKSKLLFNFLGVAQFKEDLLVESEMSFRQVISLDPYMAAAYTNLANTLKNQGRRHEALNSLKKSLELDPSIKDTYNCLGSVLGGLGQIRDGMRSYEKAIKLDPDFVSAKYNLAGAKLQCGEFKEGWELREHRWHRPEFSSLLERFRTPVWKGKKTKRLFVWGEQGIGDEIMFSSCFEELLSLADELVVSVSPKSMKLFQRSFDKRIEFVQRYNGVGEITFDEHVPAQTALGYCRQSLEDFGNTPNPYMHPDLQRLESIRSELLALAAGRKIVGISWHSKAKAVGQIRSIPLADIAAKVPDDCFLVNLQYGDVIAEIKALKKAIGRDVHIVDHVDIFEDVDDFAALVASCDKVISIDNTTVHVAGALGKECHVLLPFTGEWRWGENGAKSSYWYPSLRLHWQEKLFDWSACLKAVTRELM